MVHKNESLRLAPLNIVIAAIATLLAAPAQAEEILASLNDTKPAEVKIVSTEFKYVPATVRIAAGRMVTLVLDNRGAETEHGLFVPALRFRMQVNAGEIARKNIVVERPGEYEFNCNLPGHFEAGMSGMLIVVDR
jgi:plastocyanin